MTDASGDRLASIDLDEGSLAPLSPEQDDERRVAIVDLLKGNVFKPEGAPGGSRPPTASRHTGRRARLRA